MKWNRIGVLRMDRQEDYKTAGNWDKTNDNWYQKRMRKFTNINVYMAEETSVIYEGKSHNFYRYG